MTTAAIYLRVSTEEQARHGYSLAGQREVCQERALSLGADRVLEFADEGVSGALLQRPGLSALREALRSGSVRLVVVMDPDRLARNLSHQLLITEEIEKAKARLEFVNFQWRNTPEGQLFYAVRGAIAQFEKEKIRERTSRGRQQKAKAGKLPLAFRPFGYDYDPSTSLLTVNEAEAEVVRRIFRWLLAEGEGPNGLARRLNHLGIPARKGGQWHRNVVRQILRNPVYTGTFYANRFDTAGLGLNRHRPREERIAATLRPAEEWIAITVPAIIEETDWKRAQQLLERARRLWAGRPRAEYLLSGLLVCGRCQGNMSGQRVSEWGRSRRIYTCRRAYEGAREGACGTRVDAAAVEQAVWDRLMACLGDPHELYAALAATSDDGLLQQELAEVGAGLAQVQHGRANIIQALEQGAAAAEALIGSLRRLQEREADLIARQQALESRLAVGAASPVAPAEWREMVRRWFAGPGRAGSAADGPSANGAVADSVPIAGVGPSAAERRQLVRTLVTRAEAVEGRITLFVRWPEPVSG